MTKIIGISVGPGDPDLLTIKAYKALQSVDVVAYISNKGASFARTIVDIHLKSDLTEINIDMPMATDTAPATNAYDMGALRIKDAVESGKSVGILCEGDALFYGSFMYLYDRLKDICNIDIIPGITSVNAGSSACKMPLTSRNDILCVVPATNDKNVIDARLKSSDSIVFMKIGRHFDKIKTAITNAGLLDRATCVIKVSCGDEQIYTLSSLKDAPYFSIILVQKNLFHIKNYGSGEL